MKREKKEKRFGSDQCVRIEFGSGRVWNWFHAWFWHIPSCSYVSFGSLATYPYVPQLVLNPITVSKSPSDLDLHVFWLLILEACKVFFMLVFQGCFEVMLLLILFLCLSEYLTCFGIAWMFMDILQLWPLLCWMCFQLFVSCLFHISLLFLLCCPCFASLCILVFAQECKRVSVGDFNESLYFPISLPFFVHLYGCLVLNCLFLVHFH